MSRCDNRNNCLLRDALKWAYADSRGSDSIVGLDCCDNYKDWENALMSRSLNLAIKKGTIAWSGVSDNFVDELRGGESDI